VERPQRSEDERRWHRPAAEDDLPGGRQPRHRSTGTIFKPPL